MNVKVHGEKVERRLIKFLVHRADQHATVTILKAAYTNKEYYNTELDGYN